MPLTRADFSLFADLAAIVAANLRADTRAETTSGDRYLISASDLGSGSLMANGLYANPLLSDALTLTTTGLINSSASVVTGEIIETSGFTTAGDGGGAQWKATGNTITASQTPTLIGGPTCSDANGNEFSLVLGNNNLSQLGPTTTTFTVPTAFPTLPEAMNFYSHFKATDGMVAILNIETGFVIADGFRIQNVDLSFLTITSTDATIAVSPTMNLVSNTDLDNSVPRTTAIGFLAVSARMPNWSILVDMAGLVATAGYELDYQSFGQVNPTFGLININNGAGDGTNIRVSSGSSFNGASGVYTGGTGVGVGVGVNARANLFNADMSGAGVTCLDVSRGSMVYANSANVSGPAQGIYVRRSWVSCQLADFTGNSIGLRVAIGARASCTDGIFDGVTTAISCVNGSFVESGGSTKSAVSLTDADIAGVSTFNSVEGEGVILNQDKNKGDVGYVNANTTLTTVDVVSNQPVATLSYFTAVNLSGRYRFHSGSVYGPDVGVKITIDGVVVINDGSRALGLSSDGANFSVISLPPLSCETSILIEIYNRSGVSANLGFKAYREDL